MSDTHIASERERRRLAMSSCADTRAHTRGYAPAHTHSNTQEAVEYAEHDERERLKVIARNNLESDCLYFGRILREETEAGRVGDVEGKSQLENVSCVSITFLMMIITICNPRTRITVLHALYMKCVRYSCLYVRARTNVHIQVILDTLDWLRYNRDEDEATYINLLDELKDVAAPVMQHMSKALAQRAAGGPPPIIHD